MVALDIRSLLRNEREKRARSNEEASCSKHGPPSAVHELNSNQPTCPAQSFSDGCSSLCKSLVQRDQINLRHFAVGQVESLHYIPDFITPAQQQQLLQCIDACPVERWVSAGERKIQNWGGRPGEAALREVLPAFLQAVVDATVLAGVFSPHEAPNHVLINEYRNGAGIHPHDDGPLYAARVATITLGGPALLSVYSRTGDGGAGQVATEVMLKPGCLFLLSGPSYSQCLHGIQNRSSDSITESCCNLEQAGVEVGQVVDRGLRRLSIVLVHKLGAWKAFKEREPGPKSSEGAGQ